MQNTNEHDRATWYYERAGEKVGPLSYAQIASLTVKGGLTGATLVWRSGLAQWARLEETELATKLPGAAAVPEATAAPAPAAAAVGPRPVPQHRSPIAPRRRLLIAGGTVAVTIATLAVVGLVDRYPQLLSDTLNSRTVSEDASYVKVEDAFNNMGKVLGLSDGPLSPATTPTVLPATNEEAHVAIQGTTFQARAGTLEVIGDEQRGRHLQFNGQPVPRVAEDELRMVAAYRYADRDTVLVTTACGSASCHWTGFLLVEVWTDGRVEVLADEHLSIAAPRAVPAITRQPDGSLLIAFRNEKGPRQWRYANGGLSSW